VTISASTPGWRDLVRGTNAGPALVISGGISLHAVSIYVVTTIMPIVVGEIGGVAFYTWASTLYVGSSLAAAAGVPRLVARWGTRTAYRIGFIMFMLGSLVCALAPSMAVLLAGRLLQGVGGGMLPALGYASIRRLLPPALHARAIAVLGSVWGIAALLGPAVGGVFAGWNAWRAAFGIDVVIGLTFLAVAERVLPAHGADESARHRFPGFRLALLVAAALAVSAGGVFGTAMPAAIGILAAIGLVALMLRLDHTAPSRLLPGGAFNPATPLGAVSATLALLILSMSPCAFVAYILLAAHGLPAIEGGYMAALIALSWTAVSLLTANYGRTGARATMVAGPALMLAGLVLDGWGLGTGRLAVVAAGQILIGSGIGMAWAHLAALLMATAPAAERDTAGPFITTAQTLATVSGSAIAGMAANLAGMAEASTPAAIAATAPLLFGALTVFPLVACLSAWQALRLTRQP
jgi:MFS family permease